MKLPAAGWIAGIAVFLIGLFYLSLQSAPAGPPTGVDHSAREAELHCRTAVRDTLGDVIFPFTAEASYLGDSRYALSGVVDFEDPGGRLRNNYDCWVRHIEGSTYDVDSLTLWQSH